MVLALGGELVIPPPSDESGKPPLAKDLDREFTEMALGAPSKRYVLVYFGGRWCPSSKQFGEKLKNAYLEFKLIQDPPLELVWVSMDVSEAAFIAHLKELGFFAIPWLQPKLEALVNEYDVQAIPQLLVLDKADGEVLSRDGILGVMKHTDPEGLFDCHALLEEWDDLLMQKDERVMTAAAEANGAEAEEDGSPKSPLVVEEGAEEDGSGAQDEEVEEEA